MEISVCIRPPKSLFRTKKKYSNLYYPYDKWKGVFMNEENKFKFWQWFLFRVIIGVSLSEKAFTYQQMNGEQSALRYMDCIIR